MLGTMVRRARISSAAPRWPERREDAPQWLEQHYQVAAVPNRLAPGTWEADPNLPGLAEARWAAIGYLLNRDGPELRAQAAEAKLPEAAAVKYRKALKAELASLLPITPSDRKEALVRFLLTLRAENRRKSPPSADLPLRALLVIAWWERYHRPSLTRNSLRDVQRLIKRRG